nr:Chain P, 9-meric peptide from Serine protease/NTPase/helicase NS3 [Hepatitis C virus isolate HC-J1]
CINGVCWTV